MRRFLIVLSCLAGFTAAALAQSAPNFYNGFVPTAGQWKSYFAGKWDYPGYTALNKAGDTMQGKLGFVTSVPSLSGCGTSPAISGNDQIGEVTMGTGTPTGCTITFGSAYLSTPKCLVTWQANLASMGYTTTASSLTTTQTATSSNKIDYWCARTQ